MGYLAQHQLVKNPPGFAVIRPEANLARYMLPAIAG
jgi:hypothetical protein